MEIPGRFGELTLVSLRPKIEILFSCTRALTSSLRGILRPLMFQLTKFIKRRVMGDAYVKPLLVLFLAQLLLEGPGLDFEASESLEVVFVISWEPNKESPRL